MLRRILNKVNLRPAQGNLMAAYNVEGNMTATFTTQAEMDDFIEEAEVNAIITNVSINGLVVSFDFDYSVDP